MRVEIRSMYTVVLTKELRSRMSNIGSLLLDLEEGTDVEALLRSFPHLGRPEAYDDIMIHVFVNGKLKGFDYVLKEGDVINIHIPVSGG